MTMRGGELPSAGKVLDRSICCRIAAARGFVGRSGVAAKKQIRRSYASQQLFNSCVAELHCRSAHRMYLLLGLLLCIGFLQEVPHQLCFQSMGLHYMEAFSESTAEVLSVA